jgi:hypothetical protein
MEEFNLLYPFDPEAMLVIITAFVEKWKRLYRASLHDDSDENNNLFPKELRQKFLMIVCGMLSKVEKEAEIVAMLTTTLHAFTPMHLVSMIHGLFDAAFEEIRIDDTAARKHDEEAEDAESFLNNNKKIVVDHSDALMLEAILCGQVLGNIFSVYVSTIILGAQADGKSKTRKMDKIMLVFNTAVSECYGSSTERQLAMSSVIERPVYDKFVQTFGNAFVE